MDQAITFAHAAPSLRRRVWETLDMEGTMGAAERRIGASLLALIALNVAAAILQTVHSLDVRFAGAFRGFEAASVLVFSTEYLARLWSCTADPRYRGAVLGRLRFALTPMALVDLCAVLPFFAAAATVDLRVLRRRGSSALSGC